ncbi:MAG: TOBE domain-containing protein, partial [Clostridia bacterium]|nr:TOBE domain-containing protein [Clostridia bacterium]
NEFVAGFIGSPQMNFADATLVKMGDGVGLEFEGYKIKLPASKNANGVLNDYIGKEVRFGIRPEHVHDEPEFLSKLADGNGIMDVKVDVTELMGAEIYLYVNINGIPFTARVEPTSTAKPGDDIKIALEVERIHLFDKETEQTIVN